MELTEKELTLVAGARVSGPYKKRIYAASIVAVGLIIGVGVPGGAHIWQLITIPIIAIVYFLFTLWQTKQIEYLRCNLMKEWLSEITSEDGVKPNGKETAKAH